MEKKHKIAYAALMALILVLAGFVAGQTYAESKPHKLNEPVCFESERGQLCITLNRKPEVPEDVFDPSIGAWRRK